MSPTEIEAQVGECRAQPGRQWFIMLQQTLFPLVPITAKTEYNNALRVAGALAAVSNLPLPIRHYLEILSRNIDTYERNIFPAEHDPIENLNYLLEDHGMTASDLGRILGHRELGSKILNRQRQLNIRHIRKLSEHFKVSPGLFV